MPPRAGVEASVIACALMLGLTVSAQAQMGEMKTFRDWIAGCDNTRNCTALSLPRETDDEVAFLRLDRAAGPDSAPTLALKLRTQKLKPRFDIELVLDGAAFPATGRRLPATSINGEVAEIVIAPAEAEALIAAARKATVLTARVDARSFTISLAGSVASMLWIDERQGRLNTPTALIRKGTAGTAPSAPALPVIASKPASGQALASIQAAALVKAMRTELNRREPNSCEEISDGSDGAFPLDDSTRLVVVACSRGAYNVNSQFWLVTGRDVAKAKPAAFEGSGNSPANELVNADFDPETGQVSFYAKGRGIGDCGASGSYGWNGTRFVMLGFIAMSECRLIPGDDWITLFRSVGTAAN
ncbi:DUF1176 domain-containing protein [Bosea sp. (in: a-proteobacteria)]|uniref:DUF1176 domain-containing protein n=1 Tax=Bosea sp. (in: a-proteobacteria) TaxID=1871050 RepID=UPI0027340B13|nr:DUF1176 domain-containing protein [Bosea sp. (in: a-proteobacteria)]MDP3406902.1 DUF1176 domain-containing protein [Bosea sp. (in: a-proteobacteria)]